MEIEIVGIGDEVLYGYTLNANAAFISRQLIENGFLPGRHVVVGDDEEQVVGVLREALERGAFVITTGGLGPTLDDLTRKIVADLFGVPLERNEALFRRLKERFKQLPTLSDQMVQPSGALLFENELGTASGFVLEDRLAALPGVPREMQEMVVKQLLPYMRDKFQPGQRLIVKPVHFVGLVEHQIDPVLRALQKEFPMVSCGIYPGIATVTVHLKGTSLESIAKAHSELQSRFADHIFESPSGSLSEALHQKLLQNKISLATAESCTGGALAASFVEHADASQYFLGSIVAYSNSAKEELLGVRHDTLASFGAVSEEVTLEMASNARQKFGSDLAIAVSGIMGPSGATPTKPVGTLCATIASKNRPPLSWTEHLLGSRQMLIEKSVQRLLAKLFTSFSLFCK